MFKIEVLMIVVYFIGTMFAKYLQNFKEFCNNYQGLGIFDISIRIKNLFNFILICKEK